MLSRLRTHIRHNVVGYLALFFALTGTAFGTAAAVNRGDPASGDLSGTYPNPSIAANAVNSAKVLNDSLTGTDINESTLSGISPNGAAGGDLTGTYPNPSIANGSVTTAKFAQDAQAPDSAKLGGFSADDYGAVMSGRVNGLATTGVDWGAASGISPASASEGNVSILSPDHFLVASDLSVQFTAAPGSSNTRGLLVVVNGGFVMGCAVQNADTSCTDPGGRLAGAIVPPNSRLSVATQSFGSPPPADVRFGFRLVP